MSYENDFLKRWILLYAGTNAVHQSAFEEKF
jgi:hypothetical protein